MSEGTVVQLLTWHIENQLFGMKLDECQEVNVGKKILSVPHSEKRLAGIANLRGEVVTVVDLRILLGRQPSDSSDFVIINLKSQEQKLALKADRIHDIIEVDPGRIEPAPSHLEASEARFISSVVMTEKGLALLLDYQEIMKLG